MVAENKFLRQIIGIVMSQENDLIVSPYCFKIYEDSDFSEIRSCSFKNIFINPVN